MTQSATIHQAPLKEREEKIAAALIEKLIAQFGEQLLAVILFGSRARGEATAESDIDFLIIMSEVDAETRRQIRFLATEIWLEHGIFLSTSIVSLSHWRQLQKLKTALYRNISDEGIVLLQYPHLDELNIVQ